MVAKNVQHSNVCRSNHGALMMMQYHSLGVGHPDSSANPPRHHLVNTPWSGHYWNTRQAEFAVRHCVRYKRSLTPLPQAHDTKQLGTSVATLNAVSEEYWTKRYEFMGIFLPRQQVNANVVADLKKFFLNSRDRMDNVVPGTEKKFANHFDGEQKQHLKPHPM